MSGFGDQQPAEIHQYVRVANWLREQIVSGRIAVGPGMPPKPGIPLLVVLRAAGGEPEIE